MHFVCLGFRGGVIGGSGEVESEFIVAVAVCQRAEAAGPVGGGFGIGDEMEAACGVDLN